MPKPEDIYVNCDVLDNIPEQNKNNYNYETKLLSEILPKNSKVLQVGSMDGTRIIRLLQKRPDLQTTGIEIEEPLVKIAKENIANANLNADFILGDITNPPNLSSFDYVICLNHTLGYIPDFKKAIEKMKAIGKTVIISVYGEKFNDELARAYFKSLGLEIEEINKNSIILKDFTKIKRFTKEEVESWNCKIIETPIGYFCILRN